MFESNAEGLDVDDEFLNEVFEYEQVQSSNPFLLDNFSNKNTDNNVLESKCTFRNEVQGYTSRVNKVSEHCPNTGDSDIVNSHKLNVPNPIKESVKVLQENKRKHFSPFPIKTKRERKFPGPAGLLPDRKPGGFTSVKIDLLLETDEEKLNSTDTEYLGSQGRCSGSILEEEPWQNLLTDLGPHKSILDEINVASVKRKAAAKCFFGRKLPFLAAVLHHLDVSSPDPCIILRDSTGEIHGTLHREVWEQFAAELVVGSVLVIRNVGLLSTGISSRRHYLNITANNLVTIYAANSGKSKSAWLQAQDFAQSVHHWRSLVSSSPVIGSPASPGLFNTSLCSPLINSSAQRPTVPTANNHYNRQTDRTLNNTPHSSNVRNISSKLNPDKTAAFGKNLLFSFSPKTLSKGGTTPWSSPLSQNSSGNNMITENTAKSPYASYCSNFAQPGEKQRLQNKKEESSSHSNFMFNPVVLESKKFSSNNFPQSNSERQVRSSVCAETKGLFVHNKADNNRANNISSYNTANNNSTLILSQASELTMEEQSLVESVFEGIDADSLFDDDF